MTAWIAAALSRSARDPLVWLRLGVIIGGWFTANTSIWPQAVIVVAAIAAVVASIHVDRHWRDD